MQASSLRQTQHLPPKNISVGLTSFPSTRGRTLAVCAMTRHPQARSLGGWIIEGVPSRQSRESERGYGNIRWQYRVARLSPAKTNLE
ncbi:unnamed protein product [Fusarium graminearum]|uniref:Uncharacterized protein n=1 Tax=Gibberella zeae TaxID=5518 RepID=A0A4U9F5H7_GIBZA|nr:unnamed protein product [Fusarium graminearum]CAG2004212.1 unnamed protein product [Fusarium graminearum]CAG2004884.1 unnamed protein product [Fusarium graminearum]VTO91404.1 unnamed protein product [Fusarium graminearum]